MWDFSPLKLIKREMKGVAVKRGALVRHLLGSGMVIGSCTYLLYTLLTTSLCCICY